MADRSPGRQDRLRLGDGGTSVDGPVRRSLPSPKAWTSVDGSLGEGGRIPPKTPILGPSFVFLPAEVY